MVLTKLSVIEQASILYQYPFPGETTQTLAEKYNTNDETIRRLLIKWNIPRKPQGQGIRPERKIFKDDRLAICADYLNGVHTDVIATNYGCSTGLIKQTLTKMGVIRSVSKAAEDYQLSVRTLNINAFKKLTDETAYWIGFILADGNVFGSAIRIKLKRSDETHLLKFAKFVNYEDPNIQHGIKINKSGTISYTAAFGFKSIEMVKDLANWGIVPNKTHIAKVHPKLQNNRHFWRGMVDGDGCLSYTKGKVNKAAFRPKYPLLNLAGTLDICNSWLKFIQDNIVEVNKTPVKNPGVYSVSVTCIKARLAAKHLYFNCDIYLDRKYKLAHSPLFSSGSALVDP